MDFVPLALACGHVNVGVSAFNFEPDRPMEVECHEGCGMQRFVAEPPGLHEPEIAD